MRILLKVGKFMAKLGCGWRLCVKGAGWLGTETWGSSRFWSVKVKRRPVLTGTRHACQYDGPRTRTHPLNGRGETSPTSILTHIEGKQCRVKFAQVCTNCKLLFVPQSRHPFAAGREKRIHINNQNLRTKYQYPLCDMPTAYEWAHSLALRSVFHSSWTKEKMLNSKWNSISYFVLHNSDSPQAPYCAQVSAWLEKLAEFFAYQLHSRAERGKGKKEKYIIVFVNLPEFRVTLVGKRQRLFLHILKIL